MRRISISKEIRALPQEDGKRYDVLYKGSGYEFGFGRSGRYKGHSHLCFVDLLFSPAGIRWTHAGVSTTATLVVVPPRSYLPDVESGDFAFLKFCPDDREVVLPDKVTVELTEAAILTFSNRAEFAFPWYPEPRSHQEKIMISLDGSELKLGISDQELLWLEP